MIRRDIPPADVVSHAKSVQAGFDELWVVEDLPFAGGVSQMGAVLAATADSVVVGHGIAPAPFRNPAALAMEWAALAEMYPGRVAGGIGHGVPAWMAQIGEKVGSPLSLLRETVMAVRQLLAGETVTTEGRYVSLAGVSLEYPPREVPGVSAGVRGPKSLRLSGSVADGTILSEGNGPEDIAEARQLIDEGRVAVGRAGSHRMTVFAGFYVGDPKGLDDPNPDAPPGWDAIGSEPAAVATQLQNLIDAGADAVILVPFGKDVAAQLRLAAAEIVPKLVR